MENLSNSATVFISDLVKRYGFNKSDFGRWFPEGGEILQYVGLEVVYVDLKKDETGNWTYTNKRALLHSISDYDPMTITYLAKFTIKGEKPEDDITTEGRIYPEGVSYMDPEKSNSMFRLTPYSLHCKSVEVEEFYSRLMLLYAKKDTMDFRSLETITSSKEMDKTLGYSNNIVAIIKLKNTNETLYFRIYKMSLKHTHKDQYKLILSDKTGKSINLVISSGNKEYSLKYNNMEIARVKIIDLGI